MAVFSGRRPSLSGGSWSPGPLAWLPLAQSCGPTGRGGLCGRGGLGVGAAGQVPVPQAEPDSGMPGSTRPAQGADLLVPGK